jgi:serpin B
MSHTLTCLVLTNAIYFNAAWQHPFNEDMTKDSPFYLLQGGRVTVPIMKQTESFGYTEGDGYQAIELRYDGGELLMVILPPRPSQFEMFEDTLDAQRVAAIVKALESTTVALA